MIDSYLAELDAHLRVPPRQRARILAEVRDHLDDSVEHRHAAGDDANASVDGALWAFGPAAVFAGQCNAVGGTRAMRRGALAAFAAGGAVAAGFLLAAATQPHPHTAGSADLGLQTSFFVATVAFQVALIAGVRSLARLLAVGRAVTATAADRQLVRRCSATCLGALCVAAAGWAACLVLAAQSLTHPNLATLVGGTVLMLGAVVAAVAWLSRLEVNPLDDAPGSGGAARGWAALGERSVELVRRYPVASCATLAMVSGLLAMRHAETTVTGSIPWGALEAVAVVMGFVVLGPALGLRDRTTGAPN